VTVEGVQGVRFAVWAPNAECVAVIGDFNSWDARRHPMRLRVPSGIWELFVPRLDAGAAYKFDIVGAGGMRLPGKADPVRSRPSPRRPLPRSWPRPTRCAGATIAGWQVAPSGSPRRRRSRFTRCI